MKRPEAAGAASACHSVLRSCLASQKEVRKPRVRARVIIEVFRGEALSHIKASTRQECQPNILNAVRAEERNLS